MRVLKLYVSVYNVYITNQFQTIFAHGGRGVKSIIVVTPNSKVENSSDFCLDFDQELCLWWSGVLCMCKHTPFLFGQLVLNETQSYTEAYDESLPSSKAMGNEK